MERSVKRLRRKDCSVLYTPKLKDAGVLKMFKHVTTCQMKLIQNITLYDVGLQTIPDVLFHCCHVKHVNLSNNMIRVIPDDIVEWVDLTCLWINQNKLNKITPNIAKLPHLIELGIDNNRDIPRRFIPYVCMRDMEKRLASIATYYSHLTSALTLLWCGKQCKHILPMDIWKYIAKKVLK
jgi:Leucine-rich repeat (LRR) protein